MNRFIPVLWLCLVTVPVTAGDLPVMRLDEPTPTATYSHFSDVAINGRVSPPIVSNVNVVMYEVREGGRLFKLLGTSTKVDGSGNFIADLMPSAKGWPIGKLRVVATLNDLKQVKQANTIEIVKTQEVPEEGFETKEFVHSDIIVDTELPNGPYQVIGGQTFLIRGRFERMDGLNGNQGPRVRATIVLPEFPGRPREIICQTVSVISLPEDTPDHFWYEILIDAPLKADNYKLKIEHNRDRPGERRAPEKQPTDGFDLQVGFGPVKKPGIK
ncbi:MAG: hypothetical protein AABP62_08935 [Planctomycetota bacterium]